LTAGCSTLGLGSHELDAKEAVRAATEVRQRAALITSTLFVVHGGQHLAVDLASRFQGLTARPTGTLTLR
jgi:hypothetical protein